tara:strand:- start:103509 stop:104387 length:879 start_codon:yes stop_codon:yes gene_type:complete
MFKNEITVSYVVKKAVKQLSDSFTQREKKRISKELVLSFLDISEHEYVLERNAPVDNTVFKQITDATGRINSGVPFQYVLGKTFFYDHEFEVDERALIPRPETEELVHHMIDLLNKKELNESTVLDVGTGTGCIAISLKKAIDTLTVDAVDLSVEALDLARANARTLGADVRFFQGDVISDEFGNEKYDVIVSNPPYIPTSERRKMSDHVLDHEPHLALFIDDEDPIIFYKKISDLGLSMLKNRGYLFFEIHENFALEVKNYLFLKGYENVTITKDLQGKDRVVTAQLNIHE